MSIRSLVTSKEAGIIIGKGGSYISQIRQSTGVRVGISAVVDSSVERTLTMVGPIIKIAKVLWIIQAYSMIAQNFLDNYNPNTPPPVPTTTSIRLLVAHQLIGSVIGKAGSKIKDIQEKSGAKIVVSKGMLVDSTERVVEVLGLVDSIHLAIYYIGLCIYEDLEKVTGVIFYDPAALPKRRDSAPYTSATRPANRQAFSSAPVQGEIKTRVIAVPVDMVGCIIGKAGAFINQIRRASGAKLHIGLHEDARVDRDVTISGSFEATEHALELINNQLAAETLRRESMAGS